MAGQGLLCCRNSIPGCPIGFSCSCIVSFRLALFLTPCPQPLLLPAAEEYRRKTGEERRQASMRALEKARQPKSQRGLKAPSLDAMRSALGLGPKDHLAAAAAKMEAAEAASVATPLPAADYNAPSSGNPSPPASVYSENSAGSEAPLTTVVVRTQQAQQAHQQQQRPAGPAPSWASRDPAAQQKSGGFWANLFNRA